MPLFSYIVTETDGTRREDRLRATNYENACEQLTKRGAKIISLREMKISEQATSASVFLNPRCFSSCIRFAIDFSILPQLENQVPSYLGADPLKYHKDQSLKNQPRLP